MSTIEEVRDVLDFALGLDGRSRQWDAEMALLGNLPELTSQAVINVLLMLEERLGIVIEDDEMDAEIFATLGSLTYFVDRKKN